MCKNVNVPKAYETRKKMLEAVAADMESVKVHISMCNSKMGLIPSFSVLPLITCRNNCECSQNCYACLNRFSFPGNIANLAGNTALVMYDIARCEKEILDFLNCQTVIYKYFRFNVAGDVFLTEYLDMIARIAKKCPYTKFLFFTKQYELINEYLDNNKLPKNVVCRFSRWGNTEIENTHNLPVAITKLNENTEIPKKAYHCNGNCENCLQCWNSNKKNNTVYFDLH